MHDVTHRIPASTSNLGPGFDCLGLALRLFNRVRVQRGGGRRLTPMMQEAAKVFFARARQKRFAFQCEVTGNVPVARGLGSSVTVRLGVLHGLNALIGKPLDREAIFEACAELEGHPDNAGPAEFGGFVVARGTNRQRFTVSPQLKAILLIPRFEVRTETARALLPARIDRNGAVRSCANAAAITAAFASRRYAQLQGAFADHLHQPFRKKLVPHFDAALAAAEEAGALGAFLSGSGSTIAALALGNAEKIATAMLRTAPEAKILVTTVDNRGTKFLNQP